MNKIIVGIIIVVLALCGIYAVSNSGTSTGEAVSIDSSSLDVQDNLVVNSQENVEKKLYNTDKADTNTVLVENNSSLEIKDSIVNKTGDSSDNGDNVDFYGTNSAILVKKGSSANINNVEVYTDSAGSNAIFVTNGESTGESSGGEGGQPPEAMGGEPQSAGEGAGQGAGEGVPEKPEGGGEAMPGGQESEDYSEGGANATIKDVVINTYKDKSRGIDATYGGKVTAENVVINTRGNSCAALATDRGEGSILATNCELNTGVDNASGRGSPCIYSTGNITVENSKGTAYVSQIACIEGKNSITLKESELNAYGGGNREDNGQFVDLAGIFIYQSMSGDADVGTATLNATSSTLSIDEKSEFYTTAPMLHVTNTKAVINMEKCDLKFGSNVLLNVSGQNQWGTTGSNGGDLEFNTVDETLSGDIVVDSISSLKFSMSSTEYNGCINPSDSIGNTSVVIDSDSTWKLTGDSHISSLENSGKIDYANYTLYVDGQAYTADNPYNK